MPKTNSALIEEINAAYRRLSYAAEDLVRGLRLSATPGEEPEVEISLT